MADKSIYLQMGLDIDLTCHFLPLNQESNTMFTM